MLRTCSRDPAPTRLWLRRHSLLESLDSPHKGISIDLGTRHGPDADLRILQIAPRLVASSKGNNVDHNGCSLRALVSLAVLWYRLDSATRHKCSPNFRYSLHRGWLQSEYDGSLPVPSLVGCIPRVGGELHSESRIAFCVPSRFRVKDSPPAFRRSAVSVRGQTKPRMSVEGVAAHCFTQRTQLTNSPLSPT